MRSPLTLRFYRIGAKIGLAATLLLASLAQGFSDDMLVVTVDQARLVKVPASASALIIGNPMIADVTLLKQGGTMVITGKGFGETNLIALDRSGNPVAQSTIRVVAGSNALIVQRGMERESYTCAPRCQPTARLGDDPGFYGQVTGQILQHASQATSH
ncbi:MAG TPA: pilus assembly protein N-terminal domain-containing protein [Methylovirgula sp.]|nr:pilus assembly protein N-terminal domain-containing protein [Methylovirgula sp.]